MSGKGIEEVRKINSKWLAELEERDTKKDLCGILMNEPFSDDYWKEKYKIVICNLETNDQSTRDEKRLTLDVYKEWLVKRNRTIKRSSLFIYCLYNRLHGNNISKKQVETAKNNNDLLLDAINKVTYMNLLKDANEAGKRFNKKYFDKNFSNESERKNTIDLINALSPDIFIVTSNAGKSLIEQLFNKKFADHFFIQDNTLFVSLGHPSPCFNDNYILNSVSRIMEILHKK